MSLTTVTYDVVDVASAGIFVYCVVLMRRIIKDWSAMYKSMKESNDE